MREIYQFEKYRVLIIPNSEISINQCENLTKLGCEIELNYDKVCILVPYGVNYGTI